MHFDWTTFFDKFYFLGLDLGAKRLEIETEKKRKYNIATNRKPYCNTNSFV
jgi:hypothetical protein